ncbi:phospholipid scramblase 1-like [Amphiura filiformis]|uniref:phospholipid scramblase 1-like n=1 Tax=Amphiura filiformis TaxID=82378 RepID=UPI003B20C7E9
MSVGPMTSPAYGQAPPYGQGQPVPPVTGAQWMPAPQGGNNCPPGLEYLTQIDQLLVHQQVELFEVFTDWETANRYEIKNSLGQQVYFAHEESDTCQRQCCGPARGFSMHVTDNSNREVMRITREFKCCAGTCGWFAGCQPMEVAIEAPVGVVVGYVRQAVSSWAPKFTILDANRCELLKIEGPCCICQGICCTGDQDFEVKNLEETSTVGKVSKQWSGLMKEMFTTADNFGVTFPMDLDVKVKATMLGAVFLIDFMYFEHKDDNNNNGV